jgi:hypothetical protein
MNTAVGVAGWWPAWPLWPLVRCGGVCLVANATYSGESCTAVTIDKGAESIQNEL